MTIQEYVQKIYPGNSVTQRLMQSLLMEAIMGWERELEAEGRLLLPLLTSEQKDS